jgi:predicted Fe-Mo cluster-binding NifX family protein
MWLVLLHYTLVLRILSALARVLIFLSVMKVAITCWQGRVSPVLDAASKALLITLEGDGETMRQEVSIEGTSALHRARHILRLGVNTVICGAVSRPLELALGSMGLEVISNVCGQVDEVLKAYVAERLDDEAYLMPGCCRQRRRFCVGGSRESRCPAQKQEEVIEMPRGDGTGPPSGRVRRARRGRADRLGEGKVDGRCVCSICGCEIPHLVGNSCNQQVCPKCGSMMTRA